MPSAGGDGPSALPCEHPGVQGRAQHRAGSRQPVTFQCRPGPHRTHAAFTSQSHVQLAPEPLHDQEAQELHACARGPSRTTSVLNAVSSTSGQMSSRPAAPACEVQTLAGYMLRPDQPLTYQSSMTAAEHSSQRSCSPVSGEYQTQSGLLQTACDNVQMLRDPTL